MRSSEDYDTEMLLAVAQKVVKVLPALPSLHCALDLIAQRLVDPPLPCWAVSKDQTRCTIADWQGEKLTWALQVVWYCPRVAQLQVRVTLRDARAFEGLRRAGQEDDLREYKRRTSLMQRQITGRTIDVNRPLTLPPQVAGHIRERGPTAYNPSGTPKEFTAAMVKALRAREAQRLAAWKVRRRPSSAYGYPGISLVSWASPDEAAFALGICLAQEGLLDDATGQHLLAGLRWKVPEILIPLVWQRLKLHFAYPQAPLGLRAYVKRLVRDLSDSMPEGSFWDNAGNEYLSIRRAAKELGVHKTTIYRAIQHGQLMTEDGTPVMQPFSYQVRSGVRKTVQAIARSAIERHQSQDTFDERVIQVIRKAHGITRASAQRAYRRLQQRLGEYLGYTPEPEEIQRALCDDPQVRRWARQRKRQLKGAYAHRDQELQNDWTRDDAQEQQAVQHDLLYQKGMHIVDGHWWDPAMD